MTTTLEAFAGRRALNYSHNPTIDVEILDPPRLDKEGHPIAYVGGSWVHVDPADDAERHGTSSRRPYLSACLRCQYCGTQDPDHVTFARHSWHDAIECSRCGGVTGWPIGD